MNVAVDWPVWPVAVAAVAKVVVGRCPPWNQPQESPAALSSSPMFMPVNATASRVEQSSQYGCASLVNEKPPAPLAVMSAFGVVALATDGLFTSCVVSTPPVLPEMRLIAPGADGPN